MMTASTYVRLYVDHPKVGCGWRGFVVVKRGHKLAHLLYPPTLAAITVPINDLAAAEAPPVNPGKLAARIKRTRRARKRYGLAWSQPATAAALAELTP